MVWWDQPEAADQFAIVLPGQWFGCGSSSMEGAERP
jgi:hypothetical protein